MKNYFLGAGALAFAVTLMSFTAEEPRVAEQSQELNWYIRDNAGNYSEDMQNEHEDCNPTGPTICALGFTEPQNPAELDDSSASGAQDVVYRANP
ncbi:hypothetical protein [Olivibacter sp. XZL3]|uniref:hypothetical protein n=1 Tax=Olivibacter sp. XZL3 TaxID=1735116 RepID=UPI001064FAEC|nr:hypothetical protein [Olivibacter sp. XZL3]